MLSVWRLKSRRRKSLNKNLFLAGDFNINLHNFENNKKAQNFPNQMFQHGMISTTNKPTLAMKTISLQTNQVFNNNFKSAITFQSYFQLNLK